MVPATWFSAAAVFAFASATWAADYRAPRTPTGAPDLQGLWNSSSLTQMERPDAFKTLVVSEAEAQAYEREKRGKPPEFPGDDVGGAASEWWELDVGLGRIRGLPRTSWIYSPADGQLPLRAEVKTANMERQARRKVEFDNPEARSLNERCLSTEASGPPLSNGGYNDNYQIVQTADHVVILVEYMNHVRIVRLTDRARPPAGLRGWMGDSVGHWEGETLVIETTHFTAHEIGAPGADAKADMRVVERITRTSANALHYGYVIDNPAAFEQPVRAEAVLNSTKGPIYEFACHEGNYGMANILAGGRQLDATRPATAAGAVP